MIRVIPALAAAIAIVSPGLDTSAAAQSSITVVSPHAGERVGIAPYYVRWSAPAIAGNAAFVVHYINGAGEDTPICHAPPTARECQWFEPDWYATALSVDARDSSDAALATGQSGPFTVEWEQLPQMFYSHRDVGNAGRSGGAWGVGENGADVRGSGGDIWGSADAFHYDYNAWEGGGDLNASFTITGVDGADPWTKVGVMLRDNGGPGSPHHSIFASKGKGIAYQRRLTQDGPTLHTTLSSASTLPVQVQVMRRSNYVVMDVRQGTGPWQRAAQFRQGSFFLIGMAVTSHDATRLATGSFRDVSLDFYEPTVQILSPYIEALTVGVPYTISWTHAQPVNVSTVSYSVDGGESWTVIPGCASIAATTCRWTNPGPATEAANIRVVVEDPNDRTAWNVSDRFAIRANSDSALPADWVSGDVGAVSAAGAASYEAATGQFTVSGSGADIWGRADEFHYASRLVYEEGEFGTDITVRVASVENVNAWTKAGLMLRQGRGAGAAHLSLFVTPSSVKGVALQGRPAAGATSLHTSGPAITAPVWLKFIVGRGTARAYYRKLATDPWTFIAEQPVAMASTFEAGLAVSSHVDGRLARATFDNMSITTREFADADIGATGVAGATATNDIMRTLWGSGGDIWGSADAFRYHSRPIGASGVVSARVTSVQPTDPWAKAGVMIRQDTSAGSPHVMLIASPGKGIAMQYRAVPNGPTANVAIVPGTAPVWLRLTRRGGSVLGERSSDGVSWSEVGRVDIALGQYITGGLAVTSHVRNRLAKGEFEDVVLQP